MLISGASDVTDTTSVFSNFGSCVELYAPGQDVLSTVPGENTDVYSGTSMAAPHVAGAVARFMSFSESAPTPDEVSIVCMRPSALDRNVNTLRISVWM